MGRSVDYLRHAEYVMYFTPDMSDDAEPEDWAWFIESLSAFIRARLKSYRPCEKWDGNETRILLINDLCEIGVSEYCGMASFSIRVHEYAEYDAMAGLARQHAKQVRGSLEKAIQEAGGVLYNKQGTFSNGESVYTKKAI